MAFSRFSGVAWLFFLALSLVAGAASAEGTGHCSGEAYCDEETCESPGAMMSILACQCGKLDATCGVGTCEGASYCEGAACADRVCFPEDSDVSQAMCDGVIPGDCNSASLSGSCAGNQFCQGSACLAATAPISELACACGLLNPTCGLGQCIEGSYCEGMGCPDPVCHGAWTPISLAMCGGFPLTGCAMGCDPPTDEVAHWPLDETRTTSVFTSEWNPDGFTGTSALTFSSAIQYVPLQRNVTAFGFGDDWSGSWLPGANATLDIELFDSAADAWVPVYTLPWSAAILAGQTWTFPPLGMVTAIRLKSSAAPNVVSPNDDFTGFGSGTMFFGSDTTLRPKDIARRNHGTASDMVQHRTISGPTAPAPVTGKVRGALSFDGTGDVVIAPVHHLEDGSKQRATHGYKDLSLEAWIRPSAIDGTPRAIVAFVHTPSNTVLYSLRLVGSELTFDVQMNGYPPINVFSAGAGITAGAWQHVAVTASLLNQSVAAHVNGASVPLASTLAGPVGPLVPGDQWQIGSDRTSASAASSFNGEIDEVKVFERIRQPYEISAAVSAGANGTCQRGLMMTSPHNGKIFEGLDPGRLVPVSGYSRVAGQPVRIEARDEQGSWGFVGSATASYVADTTGMYPWSVGVTPQPLVPPPGFSDRWRETGLAWLRVRSGGPIGMTPFDGITVDDPLCLQQNAALTGLDLVTNCRGELGPMTTLVDSDSAGQIASFFPPVEAQFFQYVPSNISPPQGVSAKHHYLWRKYPTPKTNSINYYANADAAYTTFPTTGQLRTTFNGWLGVNGFSNATGNHVNAVYFNAGDLRLGRDMHCREVRACEGTAPLCGPSSPRCNEVVRVACYVVNHAKDAGGAPKLSGGQSGGTAFHNGAGGPAYEALDKAINGTDPLAAVSMEALLVDPSLFVQLCNSTTPVPPPAQNRVRFYVHDIQGNVCGVAGPGTLCTEVPLDSEQNKPVPDVCLTCHGGTVSGPASAPTIEGASFIAFDVGSFFYWSDPGSPYTYAAQEDALRQLNALVVESQPTAAIEALIDGFYDRENTAGVTVQDVTTPFNPAHFEHVPKAWTGYDPTYHHVPRPYCRTCHLSHGATMNAIHPVNWLSFSDFLGFAPVSASCPSSNGAPKMPQAEVTYKVFWRHGARADLVNAQMAFDPCAP